MRAIWLVRHGTRLDFVDPGWSRSAARPHDSPLASDGIGQVRAVATRLGDASIAHVFSSPFLRCVETADILAGALAADIKIEVGLSEWLNSIWFAAPPETRSLGELAACFTRIDVAYVPRGTARYGESGEDALRRSAETVLRLSADFAGDLLLVGHGASILGSVAGLLGVPAERADGLLPEIPYASLTRLSWQGARWALDFGCDVAHLAAREPVVRHH